MSTPEASQADCLILRDFTAWVCVDGKRVPVYSVEEEDGGVARGYIESIEGKEFTVHLEYTMENPLYELKQELLIDGSRRRGTYICMHDKVYNSPLASPGRVITIAGQRDTPTSERAFMFSKVALTEDFDASSSKDFVNNVGTIRLHLIRVKNFRKLPSNLSRSFKAPPGGRLHEKAKKFASHQTAWGSSRPIHRPGRAKAQKIDSKDSPWRLFEFRYRSRALLELHGHVPDEREPIPPSPSPSPKPKKREADITLESDNSEDEEEGQLQRRLAEIQANKAKKVKRELEDGVQVVVNPKDRERHSERKPVIKGEQEETERKPKVEVLTIDSDSD